MWADNETSEDLLGFKVHADLLIDVINDESVLPVTIGVFGDWGSGKSSILQIIKSEIDKKEHDDSLCIYFNGWTFEGYDDAKAALLKAILKELEDNKKLTDEVKDAIKDKAKKLWKSINWMTGAKMAMKNIALPAISAYFSGGVSLIPYAFQKFSEWGIDSEEKLIEKIQSEEGAEFFKSLTKEGENKEEDKAHAVADFRKDFEGLLNETKFKKLVVIIDDLDRCTPDRIIENLEAVKLFLNVPKTAFIIGADPRIVRHAIEIKYKTDRISHSSDEQVKNDRIVSDYLEKLIQVPYILPKLSDNEVETYLTLLFCKKELGTNFSKVLHAYREHVENDKHSAFGFGNIQDILGQDEKDKLGKSVSILAASSKIITEGLKGNPRQIKRFLNTYILRERLINVAKLTDVRMDVLAKLMVLEYSNIDLFRELYSWQSKANTKGVPTEITELEVFANEPNKEKPKGSSINWSKSEIINWLNCEPKLSGVDLRDYYWVSRDQLSDSISASSMISQEIRNLRKSIMEYSSEANLTTLVKNKVGFLNESDLKTLLGLFETELRKKPEEERIHLIFIELMKQNINDSISTYNNLINQISNDLIPSYLGNNLKMAIKANSQIQSTIDILKKGSSRIAKSLNS